jgi:hypothetical protein
MKIRIKFNDEKVKAQDSIREYDTQVLELLLQRHGFEMESVLNEVATFVNDDADYDIIVFLEDDTFLDEYVDERIIRELIGNGYTPRYKADDSLWKNIHAKRKRIEAGSGEKMRKPYSKGAPTKEAFEQAEKTSKK